MKNKVSNLDYLNELAKGNTSFVNEMIGIFLKENPEELKQLEQAIVDTNFEQMRALAHHMQSTIQFVGLDAHIGPDLTAIENLAVDNLHFVEIQTRFAKVKSICEQALSELKLE